MGDSATMTWYTVVSRASCRIPIPVEAFPCGSRSTTSTRYPRSASEAPRLTAVVDFPTPPFWLAIAMIRAIPGASGGTGSFLVDVWRSDGGPEPVLGVEREDEV